MPPLTVIVCPDRLAKHRPVSRTKHGSVDPGVSTVGGQLLEPLIFRKGGRDLVEHGPDMFVGQQGHGHQVPTIGPGPLIFPVADRQTEFLHLQYKIQTFSKLTTTLELLQRHNYAMFIKHWTVYNHFTGYIKHNAVFIKHSTVYTPFYRISHIMTLIYCLSN